MKTSEKIKKGLECCINDSYGCNEKCPYFNSLSNGVDCAAKMHADALAYIQQLEAELKAVKRERDAAVKDISKHKMCKTCVHRSDHTPPYKCPHYDGGIKYTCWQWRGVCPENTEVQEDER